MPTTNAGTISGSRARAGVAAGACSVVVTGLTITAQIVHMARNQGCARHVAWGCRQVRAITTAVPYAHTSVPTSAASVTSKRNISTALAPRERACSTSRSIA